MQTNICLVFSGHKLALFLSPLSDYSLPSFCHCFRCLHNFQSFPFISISVKYIQIPLYIQCKTRIPTISPPCSSRFPSSPPFGVAISSSLALFKCARVAMPFYQALGKGLDLPALHHLDSTPNSAETAAYVMIPA